MEIWTLTVDDGEGIWTTVHKTEDAALAVLAENYDPDGELTADLVQGLCDTGLVIYLEPHELP